MHHGQAANLTAEVEHTLKSLQDWCLHANSQHDAKLLLLALTTQNLGCCCIFPYFSYTTFSPQTYE